MHGNGGPGNCGPGPGPDGGGPGSGGGGGGNMINGEPNMNTIKSSPAHGPSTPREEGNMGEFNMGGFGNNGENVSLHTHNWNRHATKTIQFVKSMPAISIFNIYNIILTYRIRTNLPQYSKLKRACKKKQNDLKKMEIIRIISCNDDRVQ